MIHKLKQTTALVATQALLLGFFPLATIAATFRLEEATIADINAAFDAGALTSEQLVQLYLNRIAAYEDSGPKINSITTINPKALEIAAELDRERQSEGPRSPLHGIPVLLKDNIDTFDMPTTNGSVILKDSIPPDDAYVTQALRDGGAIILGKAAMGEFAAGSYNTIDGQTLNPYNFNRQTGGSSSGSGASIAANFAVAALGTDTSTSVRGPAAFNGLVGFRPTTGLISRDGIAPKALTFDTSGPMARTVTDVAVTLGTIAGVDPNDPRTLESEGKVYNDYTQFLKKGSLEGARLGIARDFFGGDPEIDHLAETAIAEIKELGAVVVAPINFEPQFINDFVVNGGRNIRQPIDYEVKEDFEAYLATLGPDVPKTLDEFIQIYETEVANSSIPPAASLLAFLDRTAENYGKDSPVYLNVKENLLPIATQAVLDIFDTYNLDAIVYPYQSSFASPIQNPIYSVNDPSYVPSSRPNPATISGYSSVGFPDITVPMGFGSSGLPMTISFLGQPYSEAELLGFAYDYEQATLLRRPSPLLPPLPGEEFEYESVPESRSTAALIMFGLMALGLKLKQKRQVQERSLGQVVDGVWCDRAQLG